MYVRKEIIAGSVTEVAKYQTSKYHSKKITRAPKQKLSSEAQKVQNEKESNRKLARTINANFGHGDMHIILTYTLDNSTTDPMKAKADLSKFIRNLSGKYKRRGKELKYVAVTEYGTKGTLHHHLVISKGISLEDIISTWPHGRIHIMPLDDYGDYTKLANYLLKQTNKTYNDPERRVHGKRWCQSSNLVQPTVTVKPVKADSWREEPVVPAGYMLLKDSLEVGVSPITGYPYQRYKLLKLGKNPAKKERPEKHRPHKGERRRKA